METNNRHIVLVTGAAPYLGGPQTWASLRKTLPEFSFLEVDTLDFAEHSNILDALHQGLANALKGAKAIVAHGMVATVAIESVARVDPAIPILLISPYIVTRSSWYLWMARWLLTGPIGARPLTAFACKKHRRLLQDESYVRKQIQLLVRDDFIDDALLNEARRRVADPRSALAVSRTADVLSLMLRPIDAKMNEAVRQRAVLVGESPIDRRIQRRLGGTVVEGSRSAAMIETPQTVADALRSLLGRRSVATKHGAQACAARPSSSALTFKGTIRPLVERDIDALVHLFESVAAEQKWIGAEPGFDRDAYVRRWRDSIGVPGSIDFVAIVDDLLVGNLGVYPHTKHGHGLGMLVDINHRGRGIGRALLNAAIDWARRESLPHLSLLVFPHNTAAISLYRNAGFEQREYYKNDVTRQTGDVWDTILMVKQL